VKIQSILALTLLALAARPAQADPIDDIVTEQMAVSHLPGVAVAIVDNGRVTKLAGYGDANLEWPARVSPDTRFQLASATKLFTAILLMREVERGRLSLDDPLSKFFDGAPPSWSRIRVRQLANHSSGLSEDLGEPKPRTVAEAVRAAMRRPLAYEPGSDARYGFTDFIILRAVIEKVGGASLPQLLERELVKPLGLTATTFAMAEDDGTVRTAEILPGRASTYAWNGGRQRTADFFFEPLGYGAGGLYSSARDLAELFVAIDRGKVLKRESLDALATPALLPNGRHSGFGIGWTVREYRGVPVVGHSGGPALADVIRIPSRQRTIIVLTNQQMFYPMLAERIADLALPQPPIPPIADDRPEVARNLRGLFAQLAAGADGKAFVAAGSDPGAPLRSGFGRALLTAVGALRDARLAKVGPDSGRVYRLAFERKQMDWRVEADEAGRIRTMRPL
jgi:CubicO group peptidase (beta-lactamase class C family)